MFTHLHEQHGHTRYSREKIQSSFVVLKAVNQSIIYRYTQILKTLTKLDYILYSYIQRKHVKENESTDVIVRFGNRRCNQNQNHVCFDLKKKLFSCC